MTLCENGSTPFNNRAAIITISSAHIAVGRTGCILIRYIFYSVGMPIGGNNRGEQSSFNVQSAIKCSVCTVRKDNTTLTNINLDVNQRIGVTANFSGAKARPFLIPRPNANRDAEKRCFSHSRIIRLGYGNSCNVVILIERIGCGEAIGNDHVLQYPSICKIKIYIKGHGVDLFQRLHIDIYIVNGIILRNIVQIIMTVQNNGSNALNHKGQALLHYVAHIVGNLKGYGMITGCQSYIGTTNCDTVTRNTVKCNAINGNLSRRKIQTGGVVSREVCYLSGK